VFAARDRPIYTVEFPVAFHRHHQTRWSWENWHRCAIEFARVTGEPSGDQSFEACAHMSVRVRQNFDRGKITVPRAPMPIKEWVQQRFRGPGPKLFLELGAHQGTDTAWMAEIPGVTIHAFEPDPRNHQAPRPNVTLHRAAVADRDGPGSLILSQYGWGQPWTHSSSIKSPKHHLQRYPVSFGEAVEVELVALDTFSQRHRLGIIDFIWADIQGAEGEMIRGGRRALARTRYLYTEYSDDELYEGQATLRDIMDLLPGFRVVELWPDDVLLENRELCA
jgi:FkbM family methyltransferase